MQLQAPRVAPRSGMGADAMRGVHTRWEEGRDRHGVASDILGLLAIEAGSVAFVLAARDVEQLDPFGRCIHVRGVVRVGVGEVDCTVARVVGLCVQRGAMRCNKERGHRFCVQRTESSHVTVVVPPATRVVWTAPALKSWQRNEEAV